MNMDNEILFSERQRFNQWWLWLILIGINGLFLYGIYKQVITGQQFGNRSMSDTGLFITAGVLFSLTLLFLNFRLDTRIKKDGIYVRFFPIHLAFRHYPWDLVLKSFVRQYKPVMEYGGWGIRLGIFGKGKAFNVSGNKGLQLEFTDHKKLLIGTNKPEEISETLEKIGQYKT
jgi:hypothetical protein